MGAWIPASTVDLLGCNFQFCSSTLPNFFRITLTFYLLVYHGALGDCTVDHCAMEFTRSLKSENVLLGQNLPYCILLGRYEGCLRRTSRGCRGNLKYHTLRTVVSTQQKGYNCSALLSEERIYQGSQRCLYPYSQHSSKRGANQKLCTLFGDPHLRTFDGQYETCGTAGAWPLVDNSYIGVQVTNRPVVGKAGSSFLATAVTKVTVIVKALAGCTGQKVYEGTSESLPGAFTDGTKYSSGDDRDVVVDISVRSPQFHVVINVKYVSVKLVIRRHGNYLSVAVRIPEEVMEKSPADSAQLCLSGCPYRQKIAYKEYLAAPHYFSQRWTWPEPKMKTIDAVRACREAGTTDFYFDACVFDLSISGNLAFRDAARDAQGDARRLYSPLKFYETNRTDLSIYDHLAKDVVKSSASTLAVQFALTILTAAALVVV